MTGPIYLVSACASGEEFVAAFRRYADKNGLFVPIGEPLPVGARARFAVTLKDGGVMVEGDAEVITSARTPSVLHGRVGMTLRFHEPDAPSKTLLGELAMARLAMRPQPPSVAPRPAEIPEEPRPVPPAPAGRVDAVNALAECVVVGDTSALGGAVSAALAAKPSSKFSIPTVPTLPPAARKPATGTMPVLSKPLASRASTSQAMIPLPAPLPALSRTMTPATLPAMTPTTTAPAAVEPPAVTPRATPLPDELRQAEAGQPVSGFSKTMTAVPAAPAGPSSDTYIAAVPPPPLTATITAVPLAAAGLLSAPTDIGGVIVEPEPESNPDAAPLAETSAADDVSARTQVHAGAPRPDARPSDALDLGKTLSSPPPDMAEIRAEIERRTAAAAVNRAKRPAIPEVEIAEPTDLTDLPIGPPPATDAGAAADAGGLRAPRKTVIGVAVKPPSDAARPVPAPSPSPSPSPSPAPSPSIVAAPAAAVRPRSESPEPGTDPSMEAVSDATSDPSPGDPSASDSISAPVIESLDSPGKSRSISVPPTGEPAYDPAIGNPVEISLDASIDLAADDPALGDAASLAAGEEPTGADRVIAGDALVDVTAPTLPPDGQLSPFRRDPAARRSRKDSGDWAMAPERLSGRIPMVQSSTGSGPSSGSGPSAAPVASNASGPTRAKTPSEASAPVKKQGDWVMSAEKLANRVVGQSGPVPLPGVAPAPLPGVTPMQAAAAMPGPALGPALDNDPPVRPSRTKMPTKGDWTISLDPEAPDGWSDPALVPPPRVEVEASNDLPMVASHEPLDSAPKGPAPVVAELASTEPKVQIDPTLIEPLRPMPSDGPLRAMPLDNPFRRAPMAEPVFDNAASSAALPGIAMAMPPAMAMPAMPPTPQPMPYVPHAQAPAYPMDPAYQMIPVSSVAMPRAATAGGNGHIGDAYGNAGDAYGSDVALPSASRRRRMIIIVITAIIAVGIGAFALTRITRGAEPPPIPSPPSSPSSPSTPTAPAKAAPAPAPAAPAPAKPTKTSALPPGAMPHASTAALAAAAPVTDEAPEPKPAAAATGCFANVTSQPAGAEIVVDQAVLGVTPGKVELPCNRAVDLTIRKARLVAVTRSITATPDGAAVRVALAKQTFQVKVSSMPAGAIISQNGTQLGTTPTTIKLTAFEAAALTISKPGYDPETESVTPKANGVAVHTTLKKQR